MKSNKESLLINNINKQNKLKQKAIENKINSFAKQLQQAEETAMNQIIEEVQELDITKRMITTHNKKKRFEFMFNRTLDEKVVVYLHDHKLNKVVAHRSINIK